MVNLCELTEILLPNGKELKGRLIAKLEEYRQRINLYVSPELQAHAIYKVAILEKLLTEGRVDKELFREELERKYGIIAHCYYDAFGVIWAYANNRLEITCGGTGLPE